MIAHVPHFAMPSLTARLRSTDRARSCFRPPEAATLSTTSLLLPTPAARRALPGPRYFDAADGLPEGGRWSTWDPCARWSAGPGPYPGWLVADLAAG